jgi:rhodanese-related sulfurtransferase
MELFLDFLAQQWQLASALLVCVMLLMFHESRRGGSSVSANQLVQLMNKEEATVVDLRDAAEFRKGHIVDAINIPAAKVPERMGELEALREKPLILVCKLGQHSSAVGKQLMAKGFAKVHRLGGGITEWQSSNLPLVKD